MPFTGDVVVKEISDDGWQLIEPLQYSGNSENFVVPTDFQTDFASIPTIFTWLLPRYGRYTKAAILHDWLCQQAKEEKFERADADGIFRRSMRELGVPFLRRWLMWGAVRLDAATQFGFKDLLRPTPWDLVRFLVVVLLGLAYVIVPGVVVIAALLVFYLAEWITFVVLLVAQQIRRSARPQATALKKVNPPKFSLRTRGART